MSGIGIGLSPILGRKVPYSARVLDVARADLIAYWPLTEATGSAAVNLEGTAARAGVYSGVSLANAAGPDGAPAGYWDGANASCRIGTTSLASVFDGSEGSLMIWLKNANGWQAPHFSIQLYADGNNYLRLQNDANQRLSWIYAAGGAAKAVSVNELTTSAWLQAALTWSAAAGEFKAFLQGSQQGTTQTGLGVWSGATVNTNASVIGAQNTTPVQSWPGWLAHCAIWTTPLTPAQIASLAMV